MVWYSQVKRQLGDDALLEDRAFLDLPAVVVGQAGAELGPDALVRPVVHAVLRVALKVQALHGGRTRAHQHKAPVALSVDQLVARSGPPVASVQAALLHLEMQGHIECLAGGQVRRLIA